MKIKRIPSAVAAGVKATCSEWKSRYNEGREKEKAMTPEQKERRLIKSMLAVLLVGQFTNKD